MRFNIQTAFQLEGGHHNLCYHFWNNQILILLCIYVKLHVLLYDI